MCISWHTDYSHWWVQNCRNVGVNSGNAWLEQPHRCPTDLPQKWNTAGTDRHIEDAVAFEGTLVAIFQTVTVLSQIIAPFL